MSDLLRVVVTRIDENRPEGTLTPDPYAVLDDGRAMWLIPVEHERTFTVGDPWDNEVWLPDMFPDGTVVAVVVVDAAVKEDRAIVDVTTFADGGNQRVVGISTCEHCGMSYSAGSASRHRKCVDAAVKEDNDEQRTMG